MNRTSIEWTDYTWNPITGCTKLCTFGSDKIKCYAYKMAQRLKGRFGYPKHFPFTPTFHPDRLEEPRKIKKPCKIFVCSMGELYSNYHWVSPVLEEIKQSPQHIFQILSKSYVDLPYFTYPENVWLGISVTTQKQAEGIPHLLATDAKVKFISFEPLTERIEVHLTSIDWIIIGAQTNPLKLPNYLWVISLIQEAINRNIPLFLKDNLKPLWAKHHQFSLFKEFPMNKSVYTDKTKR